MINNADHAAKVLEPLRQNVDLWKTMGESAWKPVKTHNTWGHVAEMTQNANFEYLEQYPADNFRN